MGNGDDHTDSQATYTVLKYSGGLFTHIPDPCGDYDDWSKGLARLGFTQEQEFGDQCGVSFKLFSNHDQFFVIFTTAGCCQLIQADTWPDMIALLALLSPIAIAGAMQCVGRAGSAVFQVRVTEEKPR